MFALMGYDGYTAMGIEVYAADPGTGEDKVQVQLPLVFSRKLPFPEMYKQAGQRLFDIGYRVTGAWQETNGLHRAPLAPLLGEAEEMIAISTRLGLQTLAERDKKHAQVIAEGRDPKKNHDYMRLSGALDAHCEQLAHLMWIQKYHAAGGSPIASYPSAHKAMQHLRALADDQKKKES